MQQIGVVNALVEFLLYWWNMWLIYIPEYPNQACSVQLFSELHPCPQKGSAAPGLPCLTMYNLISEMKPWNVRYATITRTELVKNIIRVGGWENNYSSPIAFLLCALRCPTKNWIVHNVTAWGMTQLRCRGSVQLRREFLNILLCCGLQIYYVKYYNSFTPCTLKTTLAFVVPAVAYTRPIIAA